RRDAAATDGEKADIEKELKKIAHEMKETVSMVGKGSSAAEFATDRLAELQNRVSHLNSRLADFRQQAAAIEAEEVDPQNVKETLHDFDPLWEQLSGWE